MVFLSVRPVHTAKLEVARVVNEATMSDWEVTELEGQLDKLYSEMNELTAQLRKMLEEVDKVRGVQMAKKLKMLAEVDKVVAVNMAKLEEARVLWARLRPLRDQRIARFQIEIDASRSSHSQ